MVSMTKMLSGAIGIVHGATWPSRPSHRNPASLSGNRKPTRYPKVATAVAVRQHVREASLAVTSPPATAVLLRRTLSAARVQNSRRTSWVPLWISYQNSRAASVLSLSNRSIQAHRSLSVSPSTRFRIRTTTPGTPLPSTCPLHPRRSVGLWRSTPNGLGHVSIFTVTGVTCQISSQYSRIARSEENFPERALLRIAMRVQRSASFQAALTFSWQAT